MSPRVEFDIENKKATTNYDYPKLKLKNGERARILLLESPVFEYVHTLNAPTIVNGEAVKFMNERKNGDKFEDYKMQFLSRPICLGDAGVLDANGSDPKNCPMCALAKENSDYAKAPQRRFAMHVIRYKTKGQTFDLLTPFSVETLVWAFTERVFGQIVDYKNEWGDLRKHDLTLGPCTNEMFQQYDINVGAKAAWLEDDERKKLTAATFQNNQIEDLSIACGTKKERKWIEEDIQKIRENWHLAVGSAQVAADRAELSAELDSDLSSLMDSVKTPAASAPASAPAATPAADTGLDDLLGDIDTVSESAPTLDKADDAPAAETGVSGDLDDLLADI